MLKTPKFKQADVTKALRAAVKAGLKPSACRITISGEVIMKFTEASTAGLATEQDLNDELLRHFGY